MVYVTYDSIELGIFFLFRNQFKQGALNPLPQEKSVVVIHLPGSGMCKCLTLNAMPNTSINPKSLWA